MTPLPVRVAPAAAAELYAARDWYAARSPTAAVRFIAAFEAGVSQIVATPERWPQHVHSTRRYRLHRFPFLIIYQLQSDYIEVIACHHARRRPGYWRARF